MQSCKQCGATWEINKITDKCPFCNADLRENKAITNMEEAFMVIIENHGKEVLMENGKLIGLLSDYAPALSRERTLVKFAIDSGAYKELLQAQEKDVEMVVNKYTYIMQRNYYIEAEWAKKALMWCASALGYSSKDKTIYESVGLSTEHIDFCSADNKNSTNIYTIPDLDNNVGNNVVLNKEQMSDFEVNGNVLVKYNGKKNIVQIPDGVVEIGDWAFSRNECIKKVEFPSSVKFINRGVFYKCSNLEEVILPEGLISVGYSAFSDCSNLKEVVFPKGIINIGRGAFSNCLLLEEINLPDSLLCLNATTFSGCSNLKKIKLPIGLSKIKLLTFHKCSSLEKIIISRNTIVDSKAFDKMPVIEYYDDNIEQKFRLTNNKALSADFVVYRNVLLGYRGKNKIVQIPDGISEIGEDAFGNEDIIKVIIPNSVKAIDEYAFSGCSDLEEVIFSEGLVSIGDAAFQFCNSLKQINLPCSLESVGAWAFFGCIKLKQIKIPIGVSKIKRDTFNICKSLERILVSRNTVIDSKAFDKDNKPKIEYYEE